MWSATMSVAPLRKIPEIAWTVSSTALGKLRHSSSFCKFQGHRCGFRLFSTSLPEGEVCVAYERGGGGLPVLTVPLPSRREKCRFTLRPITSTVADFLAELRAEDKGIDTAQVQHADGTRLASSTRISSLLNEDFRLVINDLVYIVRTPVLDPVPANESECLQHVRARVAQLYEALHIDQHRAEVEMRLEAELECIRAELLPLEQKRDALLAGARRRSTALTWLGLALMGAQFGVLARLTWWEYSWDIMEPVTYFITYGTTIVMYAYFVLSRQGPVA